MSCGDSADLRRPIDLRSHPTHGDADRCRGRTGSGDQSTPMSRTYWSSMPKPFALIVSQITRRTVNSTCSLVHGSPLRGSGLGKCMATWTILIT